MAAFCHFWRLTPDQFWALDVSTYRALARYMIRYNERAERASRRRR